jgi:DNA-binding MarR family transcriptional regulator
MNPLRLMSRVDLIDRDTDDAGGGLVLAQFLPYRIVALAHRVSRGLARVYESEDLTIPEWRVLAVVAQATATTARDVVALTPMDKMAVSRAVALLQRKGLVVRRSDVRDRRVYWLSLSQRGSALYHRVARLALGYERRLLAGFSPGERREFVEALSRLDAGAEGA